MPRASMFAFVHDHHGHLGRERWKPERRGLWAEVPMRLMRVKGLHRWDGDEAEQQQGEGGDLEGNHEFGAPRASVVECGTEWGTGVSKVLVYDSQLMLMILSASHPLCSLSLTACCQILPNSGCELS